MKPLYYASDRGTLMFASEPKALFAGGWPARVDPGCWEELMCFRYVAGEGTPYEGVRRLLPGHYMCGGTAGAPPPGGGISASTLPVRQSPPRRGFARPSTMRSASAGSATCLSGSF